MKVSIHPLAIVIAFVPVPHDSEDWQAFERNCPSVAIIDVRFEDNGHGPTQRPGLDSPLVCPWMFVYTGCSLTDNHSADVKNCIYLFISFSLRRDYRQIKLKKKQTIRQGMKLFQALHTFDSAHQNPNREHGILGCTVLDPYHSQGIPSTQCRHRCG